MLSPVKILSLVSKCHKKRVSTTVIMIVWIMKITRLGSWLLIKNEGKNKSVVNTDIAQSKMIIST